MGVRPIVAMRRPVCRFAPIHTPASQLRNPPLLALIVFCTAWGALVGGFYRSFGTGAVIGFVTSLPAAFLIDVYFAMADWPHGN